MEQEKYWNLFLEKELSFYDQTNRKYLKKGYLHFDNRIWFPDFQESFKKFIFNPDKVNTHSFYPFLKIIIKTKKRKGFNFTQHNRQIKIKERPISYAAHWDALIYSYYATYLNEKYEEFINKNHFGKSILAYRSLELCNIDFAKEVFEYIKEKGECTVITLDIKSFFDTLDHVQLKKNWLRVINTHMVQEFEKLPKDQFKLFKSLTQFSFIEKQDVLNHLSITEKEIKNKKLKKFCDITMFRKEIKKSLQTNQEKGIPQGSPMSAVLSNIYMIDYDTTINDLQKTYSFMYRRYCDDIILICNPKDFETLKDHLYKEIEKIQLTIQPKKKETVYFLNSPTQQIQGYANLEKSQIKNLQYLGFEFNGKDIYLRSASLSRFYMRMKRQVKRSINMAYGKKSKRKILFKKGLYHKFTHIGKKNFLNYVYRASKIMDDAITIKKQIARHVIKLQNTIQHKKIKKI